MQNLLPFTCYSFLSRSVFSYLFFLSSLPRLLSVPTSLPAYSLLSCPLPPPSSLLSFLPFLSSPFNRSSSLPLHTASPFHQPLSLSSHSVTPSSTSFLNPLPFTPFPRPSPIFPYLRPLLPLLILPFPLSLYPYTHPPYPFHPYPSHSLLPFTHLSFTPSTFTHLPIFSLHPSSYLLPLLSLSQSPPNSVHYYPSPLPSPLPLFLSPILTLSLSLLYTFLLPSIFTTPPASSLHTPLTLFSSLPSSYLLSYPPPSPLYTLSLSPRYTLTLLPRYTLPPTQYSRPFLPPFPTQGHQIARVRQWQRRQSHTLAATQNSAIHLPSHTITYRRLSPSSIIYHRLVSTAIV